MGRPKGGKNRYWSKEAKYEYVKILLSGEMSSRELGNVNNISPSMLRKWVRTYLKEGIGGLENKRKPGNPLVKYQFKKNLTPIEKLEYENMKLKIEVERLKKGYTTEEVMAIKQKRQLKKNTK